MKAFLSPKDLAEAIGVSESSLKRWADDGRLRAVRTSGGHRRIPLHEAVRYIRDHKCPVLRPDLLGLVSLPIENCASTEAGPIELNLVNALLNDDADTARGILFGAYFAGASIASLCDGPIRHAMAVLGEKWKHGPDGIVIEHRAFETCLQAIILLRSSLPKPAADAPLALGCSPQGDPYMLSTFAAAAVVAEAGFQTVNLGADTPFEVLFTAVTRYSPRLVWISSSVGDPKNVFGDRLRAMVDHAGANGVHVIVGGRGVSAADLPKSSAVSWGGSMGELAAFAKGLFASRG